jgi:hypothetical protein
MRQSDCKMSNFIFSFITVSLVSNVFHFILIIEVDFKKGENKVEIMFYIMLFYFLIAFYHLNFVNKLLLNFFFYNTINTNLT